jgi:nucleoside-diphosphate-sugar epimerase
MLSWLDKSVPLPLGAIRNQRSLVSIANVVSLIVICIDHPAASNQTLLVSDGEDISTTQLLRRLSMALDKPARLWPVPESLLRLAASLFGKKAVAQRICDSLQVDISKNRELLMWVPPTSLDKALRMTAGHYQENRAK